MEWEIVIMGVGYRLPNKTNSPTPPKKGEKPHSKTPKLHTLCYSNPCPNRRQAQTPSRRVWLLLVNFRQLGDLEMGLANKIQAQLAKETWRFQLPLGQIWAGSLQRVNHRATRASFTNNQAAACAIPPTAGLPLEWECCHCQILP